VLALGAAGCAPDRVATPMPIDLLRELPRAARAPAADADRLISIAFVDRDGASKPALVMRPTSRVIWQIQMADVAELRTDIGRLPGGDPNARLSARIGVSDERLYEDYYREQLELPAAGSPVWQLLVIDLSLYSGRKWSLFYRPARRAWSLVLNVQGGGDAAVALVEPRIVSRGSEVLSTGFAGSVPEVAGQSP